MIASENREAPVLAVLCGEHRPPDMRAVESGAVVRYTDAAGLPEALSGADALFVYDFLSTAVPGAWHAADRLRWLHIASAGVDPVLFPGLVESDVVLTNSRGVFDDAIAEYVLGVILAFAKDFARSHDLQREGRWLHRETERIAGREVVVVGTGPIGRAIARLLRAAGMRVSGAGRRERTGDPDFGVVHESSRLAEFLPHADYVVAVAPLTEHTKGMFDARAFAAMKPSARFVNVGPGRAGGDVRPGRGARRTRPSPAPRSTCSTPSRCPPDSPLWTMPDVLVSPHMSGDFIGWRSTLVEVFTENFRRWRAGEPLRNVVDKTLGYVPSGNQGAG